MNRLTTVLFNITLTLFLSTQGFSQDRMSRSEIYDGWEELNLTTETGDGRVTWLPDGMGYLESEMDSTTGNRTFYRVDPKSMQRARLFDENTVANIVKEYNRITRNAASGLPFDAFDYLPDNTGIKFKAQDDAFVYWFQRAEMGKLPKPLSEIAGWVPHRSSKQLSAGSYSPDYKKIAYVRGYDLYVLDGDTGKEERITFGGTEEIMNGRTDWVYPEELGQSEAFWWSPDGRMMAYLQFDVRVEHQYPLLHEIDLDTEKEDAERYRFETPLEIERYPKAGEPNPTETYLKFGQVEIDDQAAGVKQIAQRPYIDASRVGIYGGSYGGYSTCMALLRYPDVFHVGVARSSVTDWRSYDTIYTERYMRTPQANPEGYRLGSAMMYVNNLRGRLLLVHGLIDNNVHIGNTIHLADALQKAGKRFDFMVYPENRHGIGGYHRDHLDKLQMEYFLTHLKLEGWQEQLETVWQPVMRN